MINQLPSEHGIPAKRHPTRHSERKLPSLRHRKIKRRDSKSIGASQNKSKGSRRRKRRAHEEESSEAQIEICEKKSIRDDSSNSLRGETREGVINQEPNSRKSKS